MKIYTLYYTDAKLYNRSIFVMPNDEMAIKAMRLNLKDTNAERFRNEVMEGNVELRELCDFTEEEGIIDITCKKVINLKDLLNDDTGNSESVQRDNS